MVATDIMDPSTWTARKTADNRVSVIDVIAHVRGVTTKHATLMYKRLCEEDRAPICERATLPARGDSLWVREYDPQRTGRGGSQYNREGPVATAAEMVEIIWALPGNAEFRRNCARVAVRYLGGDETLIDEILTIRRAQERLAQTEPEHPARVFGEAVESERAAESEQVRRKREDCEVAELEERTKASKRRCIEEGLLSLQRCGLPVDDRDRMRAKDCINQITFGSSAEVQGDPEICIRDLLTQRGVRVPGLDSKVGKLAKKLLMQDHPNYTFKKKTVYANGQMLPANVWYTSQRSYVDRAITQVLSEL